MNLFKLLGFGKRKEQILSFLDQSAIIVDVRTSEEFKNGHIPASKNIVLDQFEKHIKALKKKNLPIITCCRSGSRSGVASQLLTKHGIPNVNGGSWNGLKKIMDQH